MRAVALYNREFEVYASVRQQALAFLDAHGLIPETMYIDADGWIEAVYHLSEPDMAVVDVWNTIAHMDGVEVMQPLIPTSESEGGIRLVVSFHLTGQHATPGLWQRFKRMVS